MKKEQKEKIVAFRLSVTDFELLKKLADKNRSALIRRLLRFYHEDTSMIQLKEGKDLEKT